MPGDDLKSELPSNESRQNDWVYEHNIEGEGRWTNRKLEQEINDDGLKKDDWAYKAVVFALQLFCDFHDKQTNVISKFAAQQKPNISISDYQARIVRYTRDSHPAFHIIAVIYCDRMISNTKYPFILNSLSVHRAYLACVLLANKVFGEKQSTNKVFAQAGGLGYVYVDKKNEASGKVERILKPEINLLEIEVLNMLEFELKVDVTEFTQYKSVLEEGYKRSCAWHAAPVTLLSPPQLLASPKVEEKPPANAQGPSVPLSSLWVPVVPDTSSLGHVSHSSSLPLPTATSVSSSSSDATKLPLDSLSGTSKAASTGEDDIGKYLLEDTTPAGVQPQLNLALDPTSALLPLRLFNVELGVPLVPVHGKYRNQTEVFSDDDNTGQALKKRR